MTTTPRILIVEDDAVLALELQETLTQLGYQVVGLAATGNAAIESALAQQPDLLLMDIRLRGAMTGIQAVEQIHKQQDIPVVYLTAFTDEASLQQAKITNAYAYLVKPVRDRELRAGLEMALYKHAAEQHLQHLNQILRAVRDINQLITREHDAQRLMNEACQILLRAHGYRFVWIGGSAGDRLTPHAYAGDGFHLIERIVATATPEQGMKLPGVVASRTRQVVTCQDMLHDERYAPWREEVAQVRFHNTVAIPIFHEENLYGVLSVYSDQPKIFDSEEVDLLLELTGDIAFGLKAIARETENQRAEEALRESEQKHRRLFDSMAQGVIYYNASGKILSANPAAQQILGFSLDQLQGKTYVNTEWKLIREDRSELPETEHPVSTALRTGKPVEHEILGMFKPNTNAYIWLSVTAIPLFNPEAKEPFQVYSTFEDITERKRTEEALRASEAKFRAVVEHSNDGILFGDANATIQYRSPSYNRLNGFTDEERLGHSGFETVHPDEVADLRRWWAQVIAHPETSHKTEYRIRHKNGSWLWVETTGQNLLSNPDIHSVVVTSRDINTRKRAEEALLESEQTAQRTAEQLRMVHQIGVKITTGLDFENLMQTIYEQCQKIGDTDTFYIALYDDATGMISFPFNYKDGERRVLEPRNIREKPGLVGYVIEHRQTLYIDVEDNLPAGVTLLKQSGLLSHAAISIPLILNEQVVGVLSMQSHRPDAYTLEQVQTLELLATQVAIAIQNSRLYERGQQELEERKQAQEETAQKNKHLTLLNHLGRVLNKLASLPEILERTSYLIGQVFDNRNLYIALYDEATNFVTFPIYWMAGERKNSMQPRPLSNGLTELVIRSRAPVLISDHVQEALAERGVALIGTICQCYLGVPILVDERVIGVIAVQDYEHEQVYNANHVELLATIASQAAIAIENARLYGAIQQELVERKRAEDALLQQNQYLSALQNTTLELVSQLDLKTLLENIVTRASALVGTSAGLLDLVDPVTNQLIPQVGVGVLEESLHLPVQPGEGLTGIVWQTGEMLVIPDYDQWAMRLDGFSHGTLGSVIGVPLLSGENVLGVLVTGSPYAAPHHFDPAAIEILNQFARLATVAVQNARLFSNLQAELSERERAEETLRESEERFRAVVQTANDAIITMDRQGKVISWNAAAETIFGFSVEEAIGMPVSQMVPEQFRAPQRQGVERAVTSHERRIVGKSIEVMGLGKVGREFPIEMSLTEWETRAGHFFTAIIRDISERKQREHELQAIAGLSAALRNAPSRAEILPVVVEQLASLLQCDAISAEVIDPLTHETVVEAAYGVWAPIIGFRQPPETGLNAQITRTRRPYHNNQCNEPLMVGVPGFSLEDIHAIAGVPLIAQEQLIGILWMGRKTEIAESEVRLLFAVSDIAATAVQRATLHERTLKYALDLTRAYDTTLEGWAHALELRDQETEGHARNVVQMTIDLARLMGIAEDELEHVRRGALLHDIGKMGIPDSVLLKPGTLNEREWEIMRRHPEYAYQLLQPIEYLRPVLDIPYCHHEKWDGSGYPRGLKGEEIPLAARLFAIVDVWEALCTDRPYRKAWTIEKVREYLIEQSGLQFDPQVVQAFLEMLRNKFGVD